MKKRAGFYILSAILVIFLSKAIIAEGGNTATAKKVDVNKETASIMGVKVQNTYLDYIKHVLGRAKEVSSGMAAGSDRRIGYDITGCGQLIEFVDDEVSGGMAGSVEIFDKKYYKRVKIYNLLDREIEYPDMEFLPADMDCDDIKTVSGLRIGVSKQWLLDNFGKPDNVLKMGEDEEKWSYISEQDAYYVKRHPFQLLFTGRSKDHDAEDANGNRFAFNGYYKIKVQIYKDRVIHIMIKRSETD